MVHGSSAVRWARQQTQTSLPKVTALLASLAQGVLVSLQMMQRFCFSKTDSTFVKAEKATIIPCKQKQIEIAGHD
eukprot:11501068-Karenia_brevis.AAC.1